MSPTAKKFSIPSKLIKPDTKPYSIIGYAPDLYGFYPHPYIKYNNKSRIDTMPVHSLTLLPRESIHEIKKREYDEKMGLWGVGNRSAFPEMHDKKGRRISKIEDLNEYKKIYVKVPRSSVVRAINKGRKDAILQFEKYKHEYPNNILDDDLAYGAMAVINEERELVKLAKRTHARKRRSGKTSLRR